MSLEIIDDDSVMIIGSSEAPSNDVEEIQYQPPNQENIAPKEDLSEATNTKKPKKQRFKPENRRPLMDFDGRISLPDYCEVCVKFCNNINFHNLIEHSDNIDNECDLCFQLFESEEVLKKHRGNKKGICYKILRAKENLRKDKDTAEKKILSDHKKAQREQAKADKTAAVEKQKQDRIQKLEREKILKADKAKQRMHDMLNRKKAKEEMEQAKAEKREQESIARKEKKEAEARQKEINRIARLEKQAQNKKEREELRQKTVAKKKQSTTGTPVKQKNQSITNFFAKSSNMTTPKVSIDPKAAVDRNNNNVVPAPLTPGLSVDTSRLNLNEPKVE